MSSPCYYCNNVHSLFLFRALAYICYISPDSVPALMEPRPRTESCSLIIWKWYLWLAGDIVPVLLQCAIRGNVSRVMDTIYLYQGFFRYNVNHLQSKSAASSWPWGDHSCVPRKGYSSRDSHFLNKFQDLITSCVIWRRSSELNFN